eukprot:GGOE01005454.1.p1 GENE.GGOE01005454.1~~GGOE01005454.1.p1  ORF type:complete len:536 (-),score=175.69 GGOE01005454.1:433-2040(-)
MTLVHIDAEGWGEGGGLFHVYPQRFAVLSTFFWLSVLQGFGWFIFAPIVGPMKATFPLLTNNTLRLLDAWSPIMYIPMAFVVQHLLGKPDGLQRTVRLGAFLGFLGTVARCLALVDVTGPRSIYCLHFAQILNGLASPTVVAPPSLLSAMWFPTGESTRATAAAVLANNVGNALAFLVVPYVVHEMGGIPAMFCSLAFFQFLCLCAVSSFPVAPPSPPSAAACTLMITLGQSDRPASYPISPVSNGIDPPMSSVCGKYAQRKAGVLNDLRELAGQRSFVWLCVAYAWSSGAYVSWTSLFDETLEQLNYDDTFIGYLSFGSTLAYILGGVVSSWVVDKFLSHRMKAVLLWSCVASLVIAAVFSLSVPSVFSLSRHGIFGGGKAWLLAVAAMTGFPNGAAAPIFYEFASQLTFPISEGASASALSLWENLGALFLYEVVARFFGPPSLNLLFTVGMGLCCIALQLVREEYRKRDADDEMTDVLTTRMSDFSKSLPSTPPPTNSRTFDNNVLRHFNAPRPTEDTPLLHNGPAAGYGPI